MRFGAFLRGAFGGARADSAAVRQVKAWARAALRDREHVSVSVSEIACNDPSCPGVETVILVMEPGRRTRAGKIPKLLDDVTEQDVRSALEQAEAAGPARR